MDRTVPILFEGIARIRLLMMYRSVNRAVDGDGAFARLLQLDDHLSGGAVWSKTPYDASYQMVRGLVFQSEGRSTEAAASFARFLELKERQSGRDHPDFAAALDEVATSYAAVFDFNSALRFSRKAVEVATASERAFSGSRASLANIVGADSALFRGEQATTKFEYRRILDRYIGSLGGEGVAATPAPRGIRYFERHLRNLANALRDNQDHLTALAKEAFLVGQHGTYSSTAVAIGQMASRLALTDPKTADDLKRQQDLALQWRDLDDRLAKLMQKPSNQQDETKIDRIRTELAEVQRGLDVVSQRIGAALGDGGRNQHRVEAAEVQRLLGSDEALVSIVVGETESHVFAINSKELHFRTIPLTRDELDHEVVKFRTGLDVEEYDEAQKRGKPVFFSLDHSLHLYKLLLEPAESVLGSKKHLIVVPSGPLAALPFHLLVTKAVVVQPSSEDEIGRYRDAAWLLKRHAVSILPSVANFAILRGLPQSAAPRNMMIGFGDPVLKIDRASALSKQPASKGRQQAGIAKGKSRVQARSTEMRGEGIERDQLLRGLPELSDTSDELLAIAQNLSVPRRDIHLRAAARESFVKSALLSDYRILYFATHAIPARTAKGVDEPSLVLTPDGNDDGLLTASEIAHLKLNADWAILSACNTAGGERPSDALSGLVRAFFYAGARALLVTHWQIGSKETPQLMISMFDVLQKDPAIGGAEALRRAMITYMNDRSQFDNANPAFWGAFIVVGEGSRR